MQHADHQALNKSGRPFDCQKCEYDPQTKGHRSSIAKLRRCYEDRWDFSEKDGSVFPIQLEPGGPTFGFCPAKVLRDDPETMMIYKTLIAILETSTWPEDGGLNDQQYFWVELVAIFAPLRRTLEFNEKFNTVVKGVFGDKKQSIQGARAKNIRR